MYLLDTNHCSRLIEGHPEIIKRLTSLNDAPVATCAIVRGELMFMAYKSERKTENLDQVQGFLGDIDIQLTTKLRMFTAS
jgi:tRNA(fMet)-specific endonuclease VapC